MYLSTLFGADFVATFGDRLRYLRQQNKVKQSDIAKLIGVSERALRFYENGDREPNIDQLIKLADYFSVSVDYLVGRADE